VTGGHYSDVSHTIDLPKLSADVERALQMPEGPGKSALTHAIMLELSLLLTTMASFAETISAPEESTETH